MPLTNDDKTTLRRAGFIPWEIKKYDEAVTPDGKPQHTNLSTATWQAVIQSRHAWMTDKLQKNWSRQQIAGAIMGYYIMQRGRNPYDFLKIEYKPPRKLSDYQEVNQRRIRANMAAKLNLPSKGRYY